LADLTIFVKDGEEIIQKFLDSVQSTEWQGLSATAIETKMEELKQDIRSSDNLYIKDLTERLIHHQPSE